VNDQQTQRPPEKLSPGSWTEAKVDAMQGRRVRFKDGSGEGTTSQMAIPDYQTLMLSVLRLAAKGEQWRCSRTHRRRAGLSDEERGTMLPSGRQRLLNNRPH
jgi:hypothetical protein